MEWSNFNLFFFSASFFFLLVMLLMLIDHKLVVKAIYLFSAMGILIMLVFIILLWFQLERPPLKTLGETRLWYSFFLSIIGYVAFLKWKYKWFLAYCLAMSFLFLLLNYLKQEIHSKELMPALQSVWFVPHVIVYIIAYAFLAGAAIVAIKGLFYNLNNRLDKSFILLADNLVFLGYAFITLGLIFGALWAKEAWGNYWTWDPKETWAFITWLGYLVYIHYRHSYPAQIIGPLYILALSFIILLICWLGINYLPSAQNSVHVYSNS
jgi:ABC-type transport system involved in cytochrome c biogenesis permease subunit